MIYPILVYRTTVLPIFITVILFWSTSPFCKCIQVLWRIHSRLFMILKTSGKIAWSNVFWYVKAYIFWNFIQYTTHWDNTQTWKKFPWDKMNFANTLVFFLRAPTHYSFNLNSQFLYELKHMVHLSKTICGILHFRFWFLLNLFNKKSWTLWL